MATTRRQGQKALQALQQNNQNNKAMKPAVNAKRQATSPTANGPVSKKRAVFGDLTNKVKGEGIKNGVVGKKVTKTSQKAGGSKRKTHITVAIPKDKPETTSSSQPERAEVSFDIIELSQESALCSQEVLSSQSSTSSSQSSQDSNSSSQDENTSPNSSQLTAVSPTVIRLDIEDENRRNLELSQGSVAAQQDWEDIDAEHLKDPYQCALYAHDIFQYYKSREATFQIHDYLAWQDDLSANMRAILVDWLVEVQENFELNHETLYLAVKIVDSYLCKERVSREKLQLLGATALFISCKFDERCPPVLDDFLYICDDAYTRPELLQMEMKILKVIGFDLGMPLSYRFVRRFARCAKADMQTLTLARFILEMSLMEYKLTQENGSKVGAAALYLALRMKGQAEWTGTMRHYTGYTTDDLAPMVRDLNEMISSTPNKNLNTIRSKYSHKVFHEVALISPLTSEQLEESFPSDNIFHTDESGNTVTEL